MLTTRVALRRLLLGQQGLLGARVPGGAAAAIAWVQRQGFLQLDWRAHALAASHDLILFARLLDYQAGDLDVALYESGELLDHYLHVPGVLPARDLPLVLDPAAATVAAAPGSLGAHVLALLSAEGPASLHELQARLQSTGRAERRAVEQTVHALHTSGAILVRQREGVRRIYDLAGRVLPQRSHPALPLEERLRALAQRTLQVLAPVTRGVWSQVLNGVGSRSGLNLAAMKREKGRLISEMLARDEAVQIEVEDPLQWYIVPRERLAALEERPYLTAPRVSFLSPLDPVVWDRQRARDLFGFDCRQQAYLPPERRQFVDFALPILYGEALVGRLEARVAWSSQRLLVEAVHLEDVAFLDDQHFRGALATALGELAAFHGARDIQADGPLPRGLLL